jgi:hypothetical protein
VARQPKLKFGSIVWAEVFDPIDRTPAGGHFCVVLNPQEEIDSGAILRVAVITTSYDYRAIPDGWYEMDYTPGRPHVKTGLSEACVVKGTWLQRLRQDDVRNRGKYAPIKVVDKLDQWLKQQAENARRLREPREPA